MSHHQHSPAGPPPERGVALDVVPAAQAINSLDPLMQFRTAWLRTVATLWREKDDVLNDDKKLKEKASACIKGLTPHEWDRFALRIHRENEFCWIGDTWAWVTDPGGSEDDELRIPLPLSANIPEADRALALALYYSERPTIFSKTPRVDDAALSLQRITMGRELRERLSDIHIAQNGPAPHGLVPNETDFQALMVALMSALARSWENEEYKKKLLANAPRMLSVTREYTVPWQLNIVIVDDTGPTAPTWDSAKGAWVFPKDETPTTLTMCLPKRPARANECAIALASYNATGAEFPFSCCP